MKNSKLLTLFLLAISPMAITSCSGQTGTSSGINSNSGSPVNPLAKYRVTLNPCNGDEEYMKNNVLTGSANTVIQLNVEAPTKTDYKFIGWSTKFDKNTGMGSKAYKITGSSFTIKEENQVLYAVYARSGLDEAVAQQELAKWVEQSQANHLYYHYYRFDQTTTQAAAYDDWDVWAWAYAPTAGEGTKFDWVGRTQDPAQKEKKASGSATIDQYAGAYIDIDLNATYKGGWNATTKKITNIDVSFKDATQIGLQIVKTSTRTGGGQFWTNDGSNLYINLEDYAVELNGGGKAYHIFVVQDNVQDPSAMPTGEKDPFDGDTGTNTTYGNNKYNDVAWNKKTNMVKTSEDFKKVGVGYQIMVSSFADSDGDGFGDIYGIVQKLDYLDKLGVKALWLTPIQLSDSYHGYDITDYEQVDPKFGSAKSPAAVANGGKVTTDTAMEDYKLLIEEAHKKGMKIVMDLVLNHTSTSNTWYVRSANLDDHFRGYYQWGKTGTGVIVEDNNWYPYGSHPYSYYAKFGSSMPELNFSYVDTRVAVEEMSVFWARDVGVDGFRLDAVKHLFMTNEVSSTAGDTVIYDKNDADPSNLAKDYSSDLSKNLQFFRELKSVVTTCSGKDVFFVGENFDGHAYHVAPYYEAFDSLFDFYTYYNLTSAAATGRYNTDNKYGTAAGYMRTNSVYQTSADTGNKGCNDGGGILSRANNKQWNMQDIYSTYNMYRNDTSLPGVFTSNHDIARVINRVAGNGTAKGLENQKNITTSEYDSFEVSADLVKIAELMLPGITWVYYGDEIGMTGNIGTGSGYVENVADIPYADLYWRQPMKWVANGQKGDDAGTTDYYVTGSSMKVEQDAVNKSDKVKPALAQAEDPNSEFSIMKKFIALKTGNDEVGEALRIGSLETYTDNVSFAFGDSLVANVLQFVRKYNGTTIKVVVNFNSTASYSGSSRLGNLGGTVLASYNGATQTELPPFSALVVKA